jgi:hypothetical protein
MRWKLVTRVCWILFPLAVLASCDKFWVDTAWRNGNYRLIAIDTRGQMYLAVDGPNDSLVSVVGPTVFSIGADDRHIVVKQHPSKDQFGGFDRSVTNYFIVDRLSRQRTTRGPFGLEQFTKLSATEQLSTFTKTFNDLK